MKEKNVLGWLLWFGNILLGSAVFALGFDLFLGPNDLNAGGVSGISMMLVHLIGFGSVGTVTMLINLPLFIIGGLKIGKKFFLGSLVGMVGSSVLLDAFAVIPAVSVEPLVAGIYGGVLCGLGLGMVFATGASTGGSDIVVRLLKMKYRNVPIGTINMIFDLTVATLTGVVYWDITKALYSGIAIFITGKIIDAVVYRFDYSKVVLIISDRYDAIAQFIMRELDRGATYLEGSGTYSGNPKKVIMTVVKPAQIADLKEAVMALDDKAFLVVQDAHQVLGEGFSHYSKESL